jgi:hypothetical protein
MVVANIQSVVTPDISPPCNDMILIYYNFLRVKLKIKLTLSICEFLVIRFECGKESGFVHERKQRNSLPGKLFSIQINFEIGRIKIYDL